jgi:DNA polymerase-1
MTSLLLDGNYLLHRIYHTSGWELGENGQQTGGCFGFLKTIHQALELFSADAVYIVWDGRKSKRRLSIHPDYKLRPPVDGMTKEEFYTQFETQKDLIKESSVLLGCKNVQLDREADDVIYQFTRLLDYAVIVSDDKDMFQMLSPTVSVYRPIKGQLMTPDKFREEFGISVPDYLVYKAIVGDPSDNIKGVQGAGEKTAALYLNELARGYPREYVGTHKNKRIRAIVEEYATVERNLELMDCSKEQFMEEEIAQMSSVISQPCGVDRDSFFSFCVRVQFSSLLNNFWIAPFFRLNNYV